MRNQIFIILAAVFLLGMTSDNWNLEFTKKGISVYTKPVPGSPLKAFKAEAEIEAPIEIINSILSDSNGRVNWMPDSIISYDLINDNNTYIVSYNETEVFVVNNRDVIIETRITKNADCIVHKYSALDRPDLVPEFKGRVRITDMSGSWTLTPAGSFTHVVFIVKANPGGIIPLWLANMASKDIPYKTILGLRRVARNKKNSLPSDELSCIQ